MSHDRPHKASKHGRASQLPHEWKLLAQVKKSRNGMRVIRRFRVTRSQTGRRWPGFSQPPGGPYLVLPMLSIYILVTEPNFGGRHKKRREKKRPFWRAPRLTSIVASCTSARGHTRGNVVVRHDGADQIRSAGSHMGTSDGASSMCRDLIYGVLVAWEFTERK